MLETDYSEEYKDLFVLICLTDEKFYFICDVYGMPSSNLAFCLECCFKFCTSERKVSNSEDERAFKLNCQSDLNSF